MFKLFFILTFLNYNNNVLVLTDVADAFPRRKLQSYRNSGKISWIWICTLSLAFSLDNVSRKVYYFGTIFCIDIGGFRLIPKSLWDIVLLNHLKNMYHIMKRIFNYDESEIYYKSILAHSNKFLLNDVANYFAF